VPRKKNMAARGPGGKLQKTLHMKQKKKNMAERTTLGHAFATKRGGLYSVAKGEGEDRSTKKKGRPRGRLSIRAGGKRVWVAIDVLSSAKGGASKGGKKEKGIAHCNVGSFFAQRKGKKTKKCLWLVPMHTERERWVPQKKKGVLC